MLYKYVRPARLDVLTGSKIRFTQPSALNDPFELRPYFETIGSEADLRSRTAVDSPLIAEKIRGEWKKLSARERRATPLRVWERRCLELLSSKQGQRVHSTLASSLAKLMNTLTPALRDQLAEGFDQIGLLSLSEVADNLLMWAHYAGEHTGFVVGFDEEHPYFERRRSENDQCYYLRPVVYRRPRDVVELRDLTPDDVFISKSPEWSYEREWRMLAPLADADQILDTPGGRIALFCFPASCVLSVILGSRVSANLEDELRNLTASPPYEHVELLRAVPDLKTKRIRIEPA